MLTQTDLKKGVEFIYQDQPWIVLEAQLLKMAQRRPVIQSKIKNLIDGKVQEVNFQQGDMFDEAKRSFKKIFFYRRTNWHTGKVFKAK
jgi:elongation factor P